MNPDGGLRVAYPTDRQGREPTSLLVGAGLADRRGSTLLPVPGSVIKRLVAVDGADLPALLLDGVFDAVFTTSDRLLEGRIDEAARGRSRPLGRVVELTGPDAPAVAPLVWGFLASTAPSADLWEDGLFDLARGGLDFSPGHGAPRTVLCATTHPATARSILDRLEIATDVRCYPDPWSVVTNSRSYCGLALASPVDLASRSLVLDESAPVADESPLLAFNRVAWASAARHPLLQRLENVVRRFLVGRSATRIELFGPVEAIEAGLADTPGVRYVRAHAVDQRGEARIEVVVDAARVQSVMETLADLGAQRMVSGRLLLADVRGRDGADVTMTATSLGRRILIHRDCFRAAGDLCPDARGEIAFTMWGMRIIKMVRHHLVDDADLLGLGRPPVVDAALDCLTETFWPPVSGLLRRSVIAPARNRHEGPPVLEPDEAVHASCFFDGYYTFATGTVASAEMLSDTRSIVEVRSASLGQGQTPLTLVRGNRLRCAPEIFGHSDQDAASTSIRATFAEFAAELRAVGDGHWADVTDTCLQLTDRMLAADPF